tara:strand:+ start:4078 stop:4809 length:732 start_codon:yes stop_codon:yes gene_type:complete
VKKHYINNNIRTEHKRVLMKFYKKMCEECIVNNNKLPIYPYKNMKKIIKKEGDVKVYFIGFIKKEIRKIDKIWKIKSLCLIWRSRVYKSEYMKETAECLLSWANMYKEATRKILKKYNKHKGKYYGVIENKFNFDFQSSYTVIELQGLVENIEICCCVCLNTMFMPHGKSCGHVICQDCYSRMSKQKCPICRSDDKWFKIKSWNRCLRDKKESEERVDDFLCKKYATKLMRIPTIQLASEFSR